MAVWRSAFLQRCYAVHGHLVAAKIFVLSVATAAVGGALPSLRSATNQPNSWGIWYYQDILGHDSGRYPLINPLIIHIFVNPCLLLFFSPTIIQGFCYVFFTNNLTPLSWVWVEDAARGCGWFWSYVCRLGASKRLSAVFMATYVYLRSTPRHQGLMMVNRAN